MRREEISGRIAEMVGGEGASKVEVVGLVEGLLCEGGKGLVWAYSSPCSRSRKGFGGGSSEGSQFLQA